MLIFLLINLELVHFFSAKDSSEFVYNVLLTDNNIGLEHLGSIFWIWSTMFTKSISLQKVRDQIHVDYW